MEDPISDLNTFKIIRVIMKIPKKILLSQDPETGEISEYWYLHIFTSNKKIEYTRTDVAVKKVCKWLKSNGVSNDKINDFKKYMEKVDKVEL